MPCTLREWTVTFGLLAGAGLGPTAVELHGQEKPPRPSLHELSPAKEIATLCAPKPLADDKPLPINLPTALTLANAQPLDIALASERVRLAAAQLDRAKVLWLPNLIWGVDYFRHDGRIQDTPGVIMDTSKSSFLARVPPIAVFPIAHATFEPLAAR